MYDPNSVGGELENGTAMGQFSTTSSGNDLDFLNINQSITCLAAGSITTHSNLTSNEIQSSSNSVGSRGGNGKMASQSDERRKSIGSRKNQIYNNDVLVVGTKTSIHVYDILHNSDLYYKEV